MKDFIFINMFMKLGEKFLGASSPSAYHAPRVRFSLYDLFLIFLNKNKYNLFTNLAHHFNHRPCTASILQKRNKVGNTYLIMFLMKNRMHNTEIGF